MLSSTQCPSTHCVSSAGGEHAGAASHHRQRCSAKVQGVVAWNGRVCSFPSALTQQSWAEPQWRFRVEDIQCVCHTLVLRLAHLHCELWEPVMSHTSLTGTPPFIITMHLYCLKTLARCYYAGKTNHCFRALGRPFAKWRACVWASLWWGICCACKAQGVGDTFLIV